MRSDQFAYWLQGWFELDKPSLATHEQVRVIRNHIELVKSLIVLRDHRSALINWIDEWLEDTALNYAQTGELRQKVHDEFVHVIDNTYPPELTKAMDAAHAGVGDVSHHTVTDIAEAIEALPTGGLVGLVHVDHLPNGIGLDGKPDSGHYWDKNSKNYQPGARC